MAQVLVLDPVRAHGGRTCPMRLAPTPDHKRWICLDCGIEIMWTRLDVELLPHCRCLEPHDIGCPMQAAMQEDDSG
jgi:hypothetical protein